MQSPSFVLDSKIIQAGAGAGKTTHLIRTFVENVRQFKANHGRFPRVVVSTFTRKATQELKERLYTEALKHQDAELFDYLNKKSWVHISTLHGLLVPFLSRYGSKAGLNPELKIISSSEGEKALRRLIKKSLEKNEAWLDLLDYLSWSEITHGLQMVFEQSILAQDFRWDSAETLKAESESIFKKAISAHHFVKSSIESAAQSASWKKYSDNFSTSFSDFESLQVWFKQLSRKPPFSPEKPSIDSAVHEELEEFIKFAKDLVAQPLLDPSRWEDFGRLQRLFRELAEDVIPQYTKQKMESGSITMADLEILTVKVLKAIPESGEAFSQEWDYWMVDEYQDTSPVQVFILSHFIQKRPHFVVGDPQQSIYLFRGARTEVFTNKIEDMKLIGGQFHRLEKNYRSRHQLVHFFNFLFPKISSNFFATELGSSNTKQESPAAIVTLLPEDDPDAKYSNEILTVMAQIQNLLLSGVKAEHIAVLSRKNSLLEQYVNCAKLYNIPVQCPSISNYWKKREILDLISLTHFLLNSFDEKSLLILLRSPWFYVSDAKLQALVTDTQTEMTLWQKLCGLAEIDEEVRPTAESLKRLKQTAFDFGMSSALLQFLKESAFLKHDRYIDPTGRREANIWKYISDLKMKEKNPGQNLIEFIDSILESENLNVDGAEQDAAPIVEPNRVTLMTIHASKGLQFPHVFVVGLGSEGQATKNQIFTFDEDKNVFSISLRDEDGSLMASPTARGFTQKMKEREADESWRVFYVALTRAQESLWLSAKQGARKNSWISNLPLILEEGEHQIGETFYRVSTEVLVPQKLEADHGGSDLTPELKPLEKNQTTGPTSKVSVTNSLTAKGKATSSSVFGKAKALEKAQFGTMAHKVFESLAVRKGEKFETEEGLQKAVDYICEIQDPPLKEILQKGHAEWGFSLRTDRGVLQGSIDLWAELDDKVYVLDYKTGSSAYAESAFEQMRIYSSALKKMGACSENKPHVLVAIYPFEGKVLIKD